jgi:hypothetical protein
MGLGVVWPLLPGVIPNYLYHFEGNSNDSSGNARNGTDHTITYGNAYGKFGQGAYFNGAGYIGLPYVAIASNCTISFWFNTTHNNSGDTFYSTYQIGSAKNYGFIVQNGVLYVFVGDATTPSCSWTTVYDGKWHNLIVTAGAAGGWFVYLDGVQVATLTGGCWGSSQYHVLGCNEPNGTPLYYYTGSMDEFWVAQGIVFTPQQVRRYYAWSTGKLV